MTDSEQKDEKIIAIPKKDPFLNIYNDITDVPQHLEIEIKHFFEVYKQLENKKTIVEKILNREAAEEIIQECMDRYKEKFGKK